MGVLSTDWSELGLNLRGETIFSAASTRFFSSYIGLGKHITRVTHEKILSFYNALGYGLFDAGADKGLIVVTGLSRRVDASESGFQCLEDEVACGFLLPRRAV